MDRELARVVERIACLLATVRIDLLPEVPLLKQQADADDRHAEIARRLELVPGDIAQTAGVNGQCLAQHELHAEVRDHTERRVGERRAEPGGCVERLPLLANQIRDDLSKLRGVGDGREARAGHGLQDEQRIVAQRPEIRIELLPQMVGGVIVGPAKVERELRQGGGVERVSCVDGVRRITHRRSGCRSAARLASACATIARASASICSRCACPRKLSA